MIKILVPLAAYASFSNAYAFQNTHYIETRYVPVINECNISSKNYAKSVLCRHASEIFEEIINGNNIAKRDIECSIGVGNLGVDKKNRLLKLTMPIERFYDIRFAKKNTWCDSALWEMIHLALISLINEVEHEDARPRITFRPTNLLMNIKSEKNGVYANLKMSYTKDVTRVTRHLTKKKLHRKIGMHEYMEVLKDAIKNTNPLLIEDMRNCFGHDNVKLEGNNLLITLQHSKWDNLFCGYDMLWSNELLLDILKKVVKELRDNIIDNNYNLLYDELDRPTLPYSPTKYVMSFKDTVQDVNISVQDVNISMQIYKEQDEMDNGEFMLSDLFCEDKDSSDSIDDEYEYSTPPSSPVTHDDWSQYIVN